MKKILLIFLMMWFVPKIWGQKVEFIYDDAGNRKLRKVFTMKSSTLPKDTGAVSTSMTKSAVTGGNENHSDVFATLVPENYEDMLGERKVTIYPNPTQGLIRIEFEVSGLTSSRDAPLKTQNNGNLQDARLLLYDVQGKLLRQVNRVEQSNILDLSAYPAGTYILLMIEGKAKSEWKIIKE